LRKIGSVYACQKELPPCKHSGLSVEAPRRWRRSRKSKAQAVQGDAVRRRGPDFAGSLSAGNLAGSFARFGRSGDFRRQFVLQFHRAARKFPVEQGQGFCSRGQGIFSPAQGIYPVG
jgi:hypothetical protein